MFHPGQVYHYMQMYKSVDLENYEMLLNIGQTMATKAFLIDEAKILSQMEDHKKKPKKTGGFQDRLQKVLEEQRKIADQQKSAKTQPKKK